MFNPIVTQFTHYLLTFDWSYSQEAYFIPFIKTSRFGFIFWEDNPAVCSVVLQLKHLVTDLLQQYDRNKTNTPWILHYKYAVIEQIKKALNKNFHIQE